MYLDVTWACVTSLQFYAFVIQKLGGRVGRNDGRDAIPNRLDGASVDNYPNIPVDLVYTWVDGGAPDHTQLRRHWAERLDLDPTEATSPRGFINNGELKLSLRTVERFLTWVRNVFIVTNGQVPDWLDATHPKIRLVAHETIFPAQSCLPSFNSHAIEFQLHRIPGLSERFIYRNDDVFFGVPCAKEDFFTFPQADSEHGSLHLQ